VRAMKFPAALLTSTSSGPAFQIVSIMVSTASRLRTSQGRAWILALVALDSSAWVFFRTSSRRAADVDFCAEFEEAVGHAFAEAGASAGDEDAFVGQKIVAEHERLDSGF